MPESQEQYPLLIKQGSTFRVEITWTDAAGAIVPLAGQAAWLHIRKTAADSLILFQLTTANNRILLTNTDPNITLYIADEDTTLITTWRSGVYDLLIGLANGDRRQLFFGPAHVLPGVTRGV